MSVPAGAFLERLMAEAVSLFLLVILVGKDISLQKNFFYDIMIPVQHVMERCPSGRRCRTRNAVGLIALVGSNPTLSAI